MNASTQKGGTIHGRPKTWLALLLAMGLAAGYGGGEGSSKPDSAEPDTMAVEEPLLFDANGEESFAHTGMMSQEEIEAQFARLGVDG